MDLCIWLLHGGRIFREKTYLSAYRARLRWPLKGLTYAQRLCIKLPTLDRVMPEFDKNLITELIHQTRLIRLDFENLVNEFRMVYLESERTHWQCIQTEKGGKSHDNACIVPTLIPLYNIYQMCALWRYYNVFGSHIYFWDLIKSCYMIYFHVKSSFVIN